MRSFRCFCLFLLSFLCQFEALFSQVNEKDPIYKRTTRGGNSHIGISTYNNGKLMHSYFYSALNWNYDFARHEYAYASNGKEITRAGETFGRDSCKPKMHFTNLYQFDSTGNLVLNISRTFQNSTYGSRWIYKYDSLNRIVSNHYQDSNWSSSGQWQSYDLSRFYYDSLGFKELDTVRRRLLDPSGPLVYRTVRIRRLDTLGNKISEQIIKYDTTIMSWIKVSQKRDFYDSASRMIQTIALGWDTSTSSWIRYGRGHLFYDSSSRLIADTSEIWDLTSNQYVMQISTNYLYDSLGQKIKQDQYKYDAAALSWNYATGRKWNITYYQDSTLHTKYEYYLDTSAGIYRLYKGDLYSYVPVDPKMYIQSIKDVNKSEASIDAIFVHNGGRYHKSFGVCWGRTNSNPTMKNKFILLDSSFGCKSFEIENLDSCKSYKVRPFIITSTDTIYAVKSSQFITIGNCVPNKPKDTVGIDMLSQSEFQLLISPNPIRKNLNLKIQSTEDVNIQVYSSEGKLVHQKVYDQQSSPSIPFEQPQGFYILKGTSGQETKTIRFVVP